MPIAIRRAVPQDAQAITDIIAASFHEEANAAHIQALIEEGEHLTFVAEDKQIVGFIDGFYTLGAWDLRRLELDLLAVHPEYSGKGIGKALIQRLGEYSKDGQFIRALVVATNTPMHHAMQKTGYQLKETIQHLYVAGASNGRDIAHQAHLIPVRTFTYTGIWLEEKLSSEAIEAAQALRASLGLEIVGAVIAENEADTIELLESSGFEFVKKFQWWQKTQRQLLNL